MATVEGKETSLFQYRVQGRHNGRLEYTPCVEMLDKSATSEWEIVTATPPSIPAGIVQYSNNKTAKVAYKRKITVPISPSTADVDVVVATSEIIAKQKKVHTFIYLLKTMLHIWLQLKGASHHLVVQGAWSQRYSSS